MSDWSAKREERELVARVYTTIKTNKLTALAAHFRETQAATRQADADANYLFDHPRRRWHMVKASERYVEAEAEMMAAFEALLAECKELDAQRREGFVCGPDGCQALPASKDHATLAKRPELIRKLKELEGEP